MPASRSLLDDSPQGNMDIYQRAFEFTPDGLLVVGADGRIRRVNEQAARMFGYCRDDLLGKPVETLIPERHAEHHVQLRDGFIRDPRSRPMGLGLDLAARRKDGSELPVDVMLSPIGLDSLEPVILCVVRDITDRRQAEAALRASLAEKDVLLREIHHRVKNNLAVISNLFFLGSAATTNESVRSILEDSQSRVQSMALVHETLYRSSNLAAIDFGDYARELAMALLQTYTQGGTVRLETDIEPVSLSIDLAIPCGLILNELITNALRHGFPEGLRGEVILSVKEDGAGGVVLGVRDDGAGAPASLDLENTTTLGLRLVRILARQIRADFSLLPGSPGTNARLHVKGKDKDG